uniref:Uncharacterized protein n=1 Tax=Setaria italica TaxID=4555 RepID=K3ZPQ5_SETIT
MALSNNISNFRARRTCMSHKCSTHEQASSCRHHTSESSVSARRQMTT